MVVSLLSLRLSPFSKSIVWDIFPILRSQGFEAVVILASFIYLFYLFLFSYRFHGSHKGEERTPQFGLEC